MIPVVEWQGLKPPEPLDLHLQKPKESGMKAKGGGIQRLRSLQRGHHLCKVMHLQRPPSPPPTHLFATDRRRLRNGMHEKQKKEHEKQKEDQMVC